MKKELRKLLVDLVTHLYEVAKPQVEEKGNYPAVLFVLDKSSPMPKIIDMTPYADEEDHNLMGTMIKAYQQAPGVLATVLLTEAWALPLDPEIGRKIASGEIHDDDLPRPSESPDRQEALFMLVQTPQGDMTAQAFFDRTGGKLKVGPLAISPPGVEHRGRLVGEISNFDQKE
jgi:hypothetical protein